MPYSIEVDYYFVRTLLPELSDNLMLSLSEVVFAGLHLMPLNLLMSYHYHSLQLKCLSMRQPAAISALRHPFCMCNQQSWYPFAFCGSFYLLVDKRAPLLQNCQTFCSLQGISIVAGKVISFDGGSTNLQSWKTRASISLGPRFCQGDVLRRTLVALECQLPVPRVELPLE